MRPTVVPAGAAVEPSAGAVYGKPVDAGAGGAVDATGAAELPGTADDATTGGTVATAGVVCTMRPIVVPAGA
jgi:hypothetical protein